MPAETPEAADPSRSAPPGLRRRVVGWGLGGALVAGLVAVGAWFVVHRDELAARAAVARMLHALEERELSPFSDPWPAEESPGLEIDLLFELEDAGLEALLDAVRDDPDPRHRRDAAVALAWIVGWSGGDGWRRPPIVASRAAVAEALVPTLTAGASPPDEVDAAVVILAELGAPAIEPLLRALAAPDPDEETRYGLLAALAEVVPMALSSEPRPLGEPASIATLIATLAILPGESSVETCAAIVFEASGEGAVPALTEALRDPRPVVRLRAAACLVEATDAIEPIVAALATLARLAGDRDDPALAERAVSTIAGLAWSVSMAGKRLRPAAAPAASEGRARLDALLAEPVPDVRRAAAVLLGAIAVRNAEGADPPAAGIIAQLAGQARDDADPRARIGAVTGLALLARTGNPDLIDAAWRGVQPALDATDHDLAKAAFRAAKALIDAAPPPAAVRYDEATDAAWARQAASLSAVAERIEAATALGPDAAPGALLDLAAGAPLGCDGGLPPARERLREAIAGWVASDRLARAERFVPFLDDPRPAVRVEAARVITAVRNPWSPETLARADAILADDGER